MLSCLPLASSFISPKSLGPSSTVLLTPILSSAKFSSSLLASMYQTVALPTVLIRPISLVLPAISSNLPFGCFITMGISTVPDFIAVLSLATLSGSKSSSVSEPSAPVLPIFLTLFLVTVTVLPVLASSSQPCCPSLYKKG